MVLKRFAPKALSLLVCAALASPLGAGAAFAGGFSNAGSDKLATQTATDKLATQTATELSAQAQHSGWSSSHTSYYRGGSKVTGLQVIGGKRYYFTDGGELVKSDTTVSGVTYYVKSSGEIFGLKSDGAYYYSTLKPMSSSDAYDFKTFLKARSIVASITSASDSMATKRWKAFVWVKNKSYAIHQNFNPHQTNWPAIYANYHFDNRGGDCHSDGAAFAYLAAAIGYDADVCIDSWASGYAPSHCWAMIGNAVYDPLFYESKSTSFYGATSGTYETSPTARFRVPQFNPAHAAAGSKESSKIANAGYIGLKKVGKYYYYFTNGKMAKSTWKTVEGKTYYFKANGQAATQCTKVKGAYYLFDKAGVLQDSSKAGTRLVKTAAGTYQVNKAGQTVSGWSKNGKKRFDATGLMLTGTQVVKGKFYAANAKGVYNKQKTAALNKAAKKGRPAVTLYLLLGKPKSVIYSNNCEGKGYDGLWTYDNFIVTTIRPPEVDKIGKVAARVEAGEDPNGAKADAANASADATTPATDAGTGEAAATDGAASSDAATSADAAAGSDATASSEQPKTTLYERVRTIEKR